MPDTYHTAGIRRGPPPQLLREPGQPQGRLREPYGGGVYAVRGARAMASGIRTPKWNNADVTHEQVDLEALRAWYGSRGMPWGLRVPLELSLAVGEPLFVKRAMGLVVSSGAESGLRRLGPAGGVEVRRIRADERDRFVALEVAAFGDDPATARSGWRPSLAWPGSITGWPSSPGRRSGSPPVCEAM